jgi:hypothetical protein
MRPWHVMAYILLPVLTGKTRSLFFAALVML